MADQTSKDSLRSVSLARTAKGSYTATNVRGGTLDIGSGQGDDFTPVELLLAAIAACSAIDVDFITAKRSEPDTFSASCSGHKIVDEHGNRLVDLLLDFDISFPDDEGGRQATDVLRRSIKQSHDRLCTVGRTVETGAQITAALHGESVAD
ncbi:MAG TPA: OsmC family protein [Microlunatus sp.]